MVALPVVGSAQPADPEPSDAAPPAADGAVADDAPDDAAPGDEAAPAPGGLEPPAGPAPGSTGSTSESALDRFGGASRYDLKLRELEEKVIALKEKIFRTKTRLLLLKERVLNDVIAEAKAVIYHVNEMGSGFTLEQVLYYLDGEKIYFQDDSTGVLSDSETIEIYNGNVLPGNHVLQVEMVYRGDSALFAYLKDYRFRLRANFTFYATKGKITSVSAVGYKKGDITYDLTQRPSITFRVSQVSYTKDRLTDVPGAEKEE